MSGDSVVAAGARFSGMLAFDQEARLDGEFTGRVSGSGRLDVGPSASIDAQVSVDVLCVSGWVRGEVEAREKVVVYPGGRLQASIATPRLEVGEGGIVEGPIAMAIPGPS